MSEKKSRKLPWKGTAVPAAICALLLTLCLLGAGFGLLAVQVTTSQELHERGALAEEAVAAQMDRIERDIRKLAEEEGFDAEKLLSLIGRERVEQMDREMNAEPAAPALTSRLAKEILARGKVPFYCSAWSNIRSARNAFRSGFLPAWAEMTVKPASIVDELNR